MKNLGKYWMTFLSAAGAVFVFLSPSIQAYVAANPNKSTAVILAVIVAAFHSTAPKDK